jgi:hypothetical protein
MPTGRPRFEPTRNAPTANGMARQRERDGVPEAAHAPPVGGHAGADERDHGDAGGHAHHEMHEVGPRIHLLEHREPRDDDQRRRGRRSPGDAHEPPHRGAERERHEVEGRVLELPDDREGEPLGHAREEREGDRDDGADDRRRPGDAPPRAEAATERLRHHADGDEADRQDERPPLGERIRDGVHLLHVAADQEHLAQELAGRHLELQPDRARGASG